MQYLLLLLGACLMSAAPLWAQTSSTVNYNLSASGQVSIGIYDANGKLVRSLVSGQERSAGPNTETWNGVTDNGDTIKSGLTAYSWKLLQTQGITSQYLTTLGKPFPSGKLYWQTALGNHGGPASVAVDDSANIYVGAASAENVTNALKMDPTGTTRLWSAWSPQNNPDNQKYQGRWSAGVSEGNYYFLQQNGWLAYHGTNNPNRQDASVGHDEGNGLVVGTRWDALYPGTTRTNMTSTWNDTGGMTMDMAVHKGVMVISYRNNNAIRFMSPNGGATKHYITTSDGKLRLDRVDPVLVREVAITAPKGVALDNAGNAYVISGNRVIKVTPAGDTSAVLTNLSSPYRLDIRKSNGDIFVAELGSVHRVRSFSATGTLLKTYGDIRTRAYGLYVPTNFKDITDISVDNQGYFLITESGAPRRVVKVDIATEAIYKEWYGGTNWVPSASPDPEDPNTVWMGMTVSEIARLKKNATTNRYEIHSLYKFHGLGSGTVNTSFGGGYDDWHVRKKDKVTYLLRRGALQVLKLDTATWNLKAVVVADFPSSGSSGFLWLDKNGNGIRDTGESTSNATGAWTDGHLSRTIGSPVGFDYYRYTRKGRIYKHAAKWVNGNLEYNPLETDTIFSTQVSYTNYYYDESPGLFAQETPTSPLYVSINSDPSLSNVPWQGAHYNKMYRVDPTNGNVKWKVGQHLDRPNGEMIAHPAPEPGYIHTIKNNVGVTHGVVISTDANGGWRNQCLPISYAWDADGLYVGGIFDQPVLSASAPREKYLHSFDNGAGSLYTSPTGKVYYFAGTENEVRMFELTGWDNWVRQSGQVSALTVASYSINAGGSLAGSFRADAHATGGTVSSVSTTAVDVTGVTSPAPQSVYQSGRHGNFSYTFPSLSTTKSFKVRLHFNETFVTAAGQRTFNVDINGVRKLTNFDVFATAGGTHKAVVQEFTVQPNAGGQVIVAFTGVVDNAQVRGIEVLPLVTPPTGYAINSGGGAVGDFTADQYGTTAFTSSTPNTVSTTGVVDPAPASVYQTHRFNNTFSYTFPSLTAGANYKVRLHFAEQTWINPGNRVFHVDINGVRKLTNFDIYAKVGYLKATVEEFIVPANASGQVVIGFSTVTDKASISGIEIIPQTVTTVYAINSGGGAVGGFAADQYSTTAFTSSTPSTVSTSGVVDPAPASVYQTHRFNNTFSYTFPSLTAGANYKVRLHFAEQTWINNGNRVFHVDINGVRKLTSFDIHAKVGYLKATVEEFTVAANASGQMVIAFSTVTDKASISGIEIISGAGARVAAEGMGAAQPVVTVFPNPAANQISVVLPQLAGQDVSLQLLNAKGASVSKTDKKVDASGVVRMGVSQVPSGLYYLQVRHAGGALSGKVVIRK